MEENNNQEIEGLFKKLKDLENEIEEKLEARRHEFVKDIKDGKAHFEEDVIKAQIALRTSVDKYIFKSNFATIITAPFIYGMIIPFVILDIALFIYQITCFTAWQIPRVNRSKYIIIDRQRLQYLNAIEKLNCVYCGYGNGILAYAVEVAGRTEKYWCPIKHAQKTQNPHHFYRDFFEYGDACDFREKSEEYREQLRNMDK